MTAPSARDPHAMPSCPLCALNDRVFALDPPSRGHTPDAPSPWPFECARCVLLFRGTDAEWSRMIPDRQKRRDNEARRTVPEDVR